MDFKNIIFDLGGVLADLKTREAFLEFRNFGLPLPAHLIDANQPLSGESSDEYVVNLIHRMDVGDITGDEFIDEILSRCKPEITRQQIVSAYNDMIEVPVGRLKLLAQLKKKYGVYLLSNIGDMHWTAFCNDVTACGFDVDELFDRKYLSYKLHLAKPDPRIFTAMIEDAGFNPSECLYIDDNHNNIVEGTKAGLLGFEIKPNSLEEYIPELFTDNI